MIVQPVKFMVITAVMLALTIAAGLFLAFNTYARKETVVGRLTPNTRLIPFAAKDFVTVDTVHVTESAEVKLDAPLLTLSRETNLADGGHANIQLLKQLDREEAEVVMRLELMTT